MRLCVSNLFLNSFIVVEFVVVFCSEFHSCAILLLKKWYLCAQFFVISRLNCVLRSPLCDIVWGGLGQFIISKPFSILNFCIRSPRILRFCSVVSFRISSRFS